MVDHNPTLPPSLYPAISRQPFRQTSTRQPFGQIRPQMSSQDILYSLFLFPSLSLVNCHLSGSRQDSSSHGSQLIYGHGTIYRGGEAQDYCEPICKVLPRQDIPRSISELGFLSLPCRCKNRPIFKATILSVYLGSQGWKVSLVFLPFSDFSELSSLAAVIDDSMVIDGLASV